MLKSSILGKEKKGINNEIDTKAKKGKEEETTRFVADYRKNPKSAKMIREICKRINNKDWGEEVSFSAIAFKALPLLSKNDINDLQEQSRTRKESILDGVKKYNKENRTTLTKDEYTCMLMEQVAQLSQNHGGQ